MPLIYRGTTYEPTTTAGLDWVEVETATYRGVPYKSYQLATTTVPQTPPTRRVYRGVTY